VPYLRKMEDLELASALAAQDAADALIVLGLPVTPYGPDMGEWQIGAPISTDDELMQLAARVGIQPPFERLQ